VLPDDRPEQPSLRAIAIAAIVAAVAAAAGAAIAPDPWPAGDGAAIVRVGDRPEARAAVPIGGREAITATAGEASVQFPGGIPTDAPVTARIQVVRDGAPVDLGIDDVSLSLELPDGRRELVPILSWSAKDHALTAKRRPPVHSAVLMALLGLVVVLWVSEVIPLFATSLLIPVVLVVAGVGAPKPALAPFFHPLIVLFFGTFLIAEAINRVGLDRVAAIHLVARFGRSPATLFAAMMATAALFSMWMTNTGATILLIPIALAVTAPLDNKPFRKVVVLGIAYAATTGGIATVVGTPANALAVELVGAFNGRHIGFVEWLGFGLPMVLLFLPIIGAYLWWRGKVHVDRERFAEARRVAAEERAALPRTTPAQWAVLAVFAGVVGMWLTTSWHGVHPGVIALGGALVLVVLRQIQTEDLQRISWNALITFGGGLTLGYYLAESGTSDWMATSLARLSGVPGALAIAAVGAFALIVTAFASNTASAAMLIPVALPLGSVLGVDPTTLAVVVAIASSVDYAMVIGTPPTMIAYSTRLFTTREIFRVGAILDLLGILLLVTVVVWFWRLIGL